MRAQDIYAATFGNARPQRCSSRVDNSIQRKYRRANGSEADWLRRRRAVAAAQDCPSLLDGTLRAQETIMSNYDDQRPSERCDRHENDSQHQQRKQNTYKV